MHNDGDRASRLLKAAAGATFCLLLATTVLGAQLETPRLTFVQSGNGRVELLVTAGATGTPGGFTIRWATEEDFLSDGGEWIPGVQSQGRCHYYGTPTLNNFPGEPGTFVLEPHQSISVQPGDIDDESGVDSNIWGELLYNTDYVTR